VSGGWGGGSVTVGGGGGLNGGGGTIGTVGGGTGLPTQHACLELLDLPESGSANALAEVCAAVALGGELSIVGALVAGQFTAAHASRTR